MARICVRAQFIFDEAIIKVVGLQQRIVVVDLFVTYGSFASGTSAICQRFGMIMVCKLL
jgi:hypothetical protein